MGPSKTSNGKFEMDMLDWEIVELLQKNEKLTFAQLALKLGLSHANVVDRIKRLGALILNYWKEREGQSADFAITAFIRLRLPNDKVKRRISRAPEVRECYQIGEPRVFQIKIMVRDSEHLRRSVETLKTAGDALTLIVLWPMVVPKLTAG